MLTKEFILAGKAIITVSNNNTNNWYTYRIKFAAATERWPEAYFVEVLTGPDNTRSYTKMGKVNPDTGVVTLNRYTNYTNESTPVKVINWALSLIWKGQEPPAGYSIQHNGRCGHCQRPLTTPDSIASGIGPICGRREAQRPNRTVAA